MQYVNILAEQTSLLKRKLTEKDKLNKNIFRI